MTTFKVIEIIDGDTIRVSPKWQWIGPNNQNLAGSELRIFGYVLPHKATYGYKYAKQKLEKLLLNKKVVLKNPMLTKDDELACNVLIDNIDVSYYFPEYRVR